ncbi:nascent polypeptide-associated complex protein [Aeropyrum pernix]|uniref:nascent polypeptide-associated complex protein n=1 Tax=Aeropyrum pernix TaxID=56636 RepID=UPI00005C935B|nr:nascent polypeptide-associated complex protein [Aeropyrum pernix]
MVGSVLPVNPRDLEKMMRRLGIKVEQLSADEARIVLGSGETMVFRSPTVIVMRAKGQPPMVYLVGDYTVEKPREETAAEITEEDVALVAEQAGVSMEEARKALEESGGDIAEAILRLKGEE